MNPSRLARLIFVGGIVLQSGCASLPIDQIDLMPAPDVYGDGMLNPLPEQNPYEEMPYQGILYATDRRPATPEDREKYYVNDRGQIVRVGVARVELGKKKFTWEEARLISMRKSRTEKYPIKVSDVDEWGIMQSSVPFWLDIASETGGNPPPDATERFVEAINAKLAQSERKDIYLYVHGYRVVYENPVLVSAELWHFLGYESVFIAYAWPSTPSKFAYIKDSDTSGGFARNFRLMLELLAGKTDAERIHVLGYSNGTRLVTRAMEQLALINQSMTEDAIYEKLRIHEVILVGSDLDRGVFDSYLADGLLKVSKHLTVYMSKYDKALGVSQFLTRRQRLGQMFGGVGDELSDSDRETILEYRDQISFIDVSDAEGASSGAGRGYFRSSPWASSDILMTLIYGLKPEERGLTDQKDLPVYTFPPDYISRLWEAIEDVDSDFAEAYNAFKAARK